MNLNYQQVTHEQLLEQFKNRIISDPKYKDLSASSIFQIYMEMMAGTFDMLHFYLGRTAEEMFFDSARLDSSVIKLSKNLGYNPRRAIPATANIAIKLIGPLPKNAAIGDVIWFNNEQLSLKFNNKPYRLDYCYSYTLTADDIMNGVDNSNWTKTIQYSVPSDVENGWIPLTSNVNGLDKIKIVQCEVKTKEIYAIANAEHLTEAYQFYDIDDISFSNYYGLRDPYAYYNNEYIPANGWCKVGIGLNKTDAFSPEKLCDIEIENIYCNKKVKAANDEDVLTKKLNVCRIESNQDKTVRISFGDGAIANNGFNDEDEILYVQYVVTDGYSANMSDVIDSVLSNSSRIMAHSPGKVYDITDNVSFVLTSNISNGDDFESIQRMKNNAAVYFASRGQLVNKKDFNDYFSSMSRPIHALNAVAWTSNELKSETDLQNTTNDSRKNNAIVSFDNSCKNTQDAVFYTVIGDMYESLGNDKYKPREVYTAEDNSVVGTSTLYNGKDDLLSHLTDLTTCCQIGIDSIARAQQSSKSDPFYINTNEIYNDIEEKLQFGVTPICIPPIVQYFDLVGTVEIDRTSNVANYQNEVEGKIYKWLVDNQKFNNKIYKSDIIKMLYENAATKTVNVDMTPSSLTKDTADYYLFKKLSSKIIEGEDQSYIIGTNGYNNNIIVISAQSTGSILNSANYTNSNTAVAMSSSLIQAAKSIGIGIKSDGSADTTIPSMLQVGIKSVTDLSDGRIQITLNDSNYNLPEITDASVLYLQINTEEAQFYSKVPVDTPTTSSVITYMFSNLDDTDMTSVTSTIATPVALPYTAELTVANAGDKGSIILRSVAERSLTYSRRKNTQNPLALNEKTFNMIASKLSTNDYVENYKIVKHIIEDSILDDNNNIVNYSLPNEISVVRLKLRYTYGR